LGFDHPEVRLDFAEETIKWLRFHALGRNTQHVFNNAFIFRMNSRADATSFRMLALCNAALPGASAIAASNTVSSDKTPQYSAMT
jgi:hypothetical protein